MVGENKTLKFISMQFKDVFIDQNLKNKLLELVQTGRIAHAQFFLTHPGSHALALAIALGQYLCCENPSDEDSCGECPSCKQYANLAHPDLHLYFPNCITENIKKDPESSKLANEFRNFVFKHNFFVNINSWLNELKGENKQPSINIRDCSNILYYNSMRSFQNGYKVYILWGADKLYRDAAPKLLKTLEEPEEKSLFILISEEPDKILNTILSRTQLIKITRLSDSSISSNLLKDFPELTEQEANDIAIIANGDYIKASQLASNNEDETDFLEYFEQFFDSIFAFAHRLSLHEINYNGITEIISSISAQGREYQKQFLAFSLKMLRNILLSNTNNKEILKVTHKEQYVLDKFNGKFQLKQVSQMYELCNKAIYHITRYGNVSLILTDLYFQLAKVSV